MTKKLCALLLLAALLLSSLPLASAAVLERGSRGERVLALKQRMYELGYFTSEKFSEEYNGTTADRVRQLQEKNGLKKTGKVDDALWELIFSDYCVAADGTAVATQAPTPEPTPAPEATEAPAEEAAEVTEIAASQDVHAPHPVPGAPERDEKGFLTEDTEFVVKDMENGFWAYLSDTLQVVIYRKQDEQQKVIWFEGDIRTAEGERMKPIASDRNKWMYPQAIARAHKAVLAISDDFHNFRQYNKLVVGTVIRNGEIISSKTKRAGATGYPKLENMAYFPDGTLKCYDTRAYTAQEYLDMGATDVLAFGPILVTDGQLGENMRETEAEAKKRAYYHFHEPRMALGMVEPGHYLVLDVCGRSSDKQSAIPGVSKNFSKGVYLDWLALKMRELGATEAINLDGGYTVSLCFLGESLNIRPTMSRKTKTILSFGVSDLCIQD